MRRILLFLVLALALAACGEEATEPRQPPEPAATQTPLPTFAITPPPVLYVREGELFEQSGDAPARRLADLAEAGPALAAAAVDDEVLVLRERGLQRVKLEDGASDTIQSFEQPVLLGQLVPVEGGDRVIVQVVRDEPGAPFGFATRIAIFDGSSGTVRELLAADELTEYTTVQPLGLSADGNSLYLLPRGQDPSFVRLLEASLESGEIVADLPIEGEGEAALAPGGRRLAVTLRRLFPDASPEHIVALYDVTDQPPTRRMVSLPQASNLPTGLQWSPDGRFLYFALAAVDPSGQQPTLTSLLRLDVNSGDVVEVAKVDIADGQPVTISPNGEWLLLRAMTGEQATLVHLPTGATEPLTLPPTAIIAGWQ